jgi:DNA-binding LacI/PurR family transcriptional regulator
MADNPQETDPKHLRLRRFLAEQVGRGVYAPGQFLPSEPELAREWGVARGTVRQALAGLEEDGVVERVQGRGTVVRAGAETGAGARTTLSVMALILPELRSGFYPSLAQGFDQGAGQVNYQVLTSCTDNDVRKQGDIVLQLIDKKVAGVAIVPPTVGPGCAHQIRQLQAHGIPVVLLHRPVEGVSAPLISLPYQAIAATAGRMLAERGHRRVAIFQTHLYAAGPSYVAGLRDELRRAGGDVPDELVVYGTSSTTEQFAAQEEEIAQQVDRVFNLPPQQRPSAIFDPWDSVSELLYLLLQSRGLRVPQDVSLVSFGGRWRPTPMSRRLSAVTVDETATGQLAARLLEEMISGRRALEDRETFSMPLGTHAGETLGPAKIGDHDGSN